MENMWRDIKCGLCGIQRTGSSHLKIEKTKKRKIVMDETKPKPQNKNRVTIDPHSKQKLNDWRTQLGQKFPGIHISDSEFVNWLILKQSSTLTAKQFSEIKEVFFDEIKELEWKLAQARAVQAGLALSHTSNENAR